MQCQLFDSKLLLKDIENIVFIFFSLAVGLAAGTGLHSLAVIGTILIGSVMLISSEYNIEYPHQNEILVQFSYQKAKKTDRPYIPIFDKFYKTADLINIKSIEEKDIFEISYYIQLQNIDESKKFVQ